MKNFREASLIKLVNNILLPLLLVSILLFTTACNLLESQYHNRQYNNKILSKEECVTEIKRLLSIDEIYYFDCDFSNIADIEIIDYSFNLSVIGTFIKDEETSKQVLDLTKQAEVFIVANYKIKSEGKCSGFSIVSRVMTPGMQHYNNGVLEYETNNEIYNSTTFTSFSELIGESGNGTTYQNNETVDEIKVPDNFYNFKLSNSINPICQYSKYSSSLNGHRILHTPIWIVTHYEDYDTFKDDKSFSTMGKIRSHLKSNATYTKK